MCCSTEKHTDIRLIIYSFVSAVCLQSVCVFAVSRYWLWLQMRPVHPSGQWHPSLPGPHSPPLEQSSQVRLQSWPNMLFRHTAYRTEEITDYNVLEKDLLVVRDLQIFNSILPSNPWWDDLKKYNTDCCFHINKSRNNTKQILWLSAIAPCHSL